MLKNKPYLKPLLWMIAFTLPWGLGGFIVHTAFSLSAGMILYWVAGSWLLLFSIWSRKKAGEVKGEPPGCGTPGGVAVPCPCGDGGFLEISSGH